MPTIRAWISLEFSTFTGGPGSARATVAKGMTQTTQRQARRQGWKACNMSFTYILFTPPFNAPIQRVDVFLVEAGCAAQMQGLVRADTVRLDRHVYALLPKEASNHLRPLKRESHVVVRPATNISMPDKYDMRRLLLFNRAGEFHCRLFAFRREARGSIVERDRHWNGTRDDAPHLG